MPPVERDQYGLRSSTASKYVPRYADNSEEGRKEAERVEKQWKSLMGETKKLREALNLTHFVSVSLEKMSCLLEPEPSYHALFTALPPLCYPKEGQNKLENLKREQREVERTLRYVTEQNSFLTCLLRRINSAVLTSNNRTLVALDDPDDAFENPFYRYHRRRCHMTPSESVRRQHIGILCPGWTKGASAGLEMAQEHVVHHLNDSDTSFPPFISVSDSPGRIHNIMKADMGRRANSATILVISRQKLKKMNVNFQKSTDLVQMFGLKTYCASRPNGVHYATESHWMALRWIPAECIVGTMDTECFEAFCVSHGVVPQDSSLYTPLFCWSSQP